MMNKLVQHWKKAPLDAPPFLHPDDQVILKRASAVSSYEGYIKELAVGANHQTFHLSLMPVPYFGDLDNAEVIILLLNPSLHPSDYLLEEQFPEFRDEVRSVIRQQSRTHPFLDLRWAWTSGFTWWERKLGEIARVIASERFNGHYGEALRSLSNHVAVIEMVPYHSKSFGRPVDIPSARVAMEFVKQVVEERTRTIIVTRKVREWGLAPSDKVITYSAGQARGASLSPRSPGGRAILSTYGVV